MGFGFRVWLGWVGIWMALRVYTVMVYEGLDSGRWVAMVGLGY